MSFYGKDSSEIIDNITINCTIDGKNVKYDTFKSKGEIIITIP
jgi:hypothetical protein